MTTTRVGSKSLVWTVWMVASIFYAYQYILRVMPNIMLDDIMHRFSIGASAFGQFSGVYYIGYSLMHLPLGIMLDRFGPKKVMSGCILLTVVGLMPLIFADHWAYPVLGRFLIGLGSSAAILGVFKIIRMTFHERLFSRMLSFSVTIGLIGAIYGGGPMSYMRDLLGYDLVIEIFAGMGLVLALVTYLLVPNSKTTSEGTVFSNIKEVLTNKKVILSCIFAGLMLGPLEGFADVWGSSFLKSVYGLNGSIAASLPSMIFIGMCFGGPILSFIAEKAKSYLGAIIGAGVLMCLSFFLLLGWIIPTTMVTMSFILVGICSAYQILAIYMVSTYVREEVSGLATALANMIIMLFGYGFHTTMGTIIGSFGGATNPKAIVYGVAVIPIALALGTLGFALQRIFQRSRKKALA